MLPEICNGSGSTTPSLVDSTGARFTSISASGTLYLSPQTIVVGGGTAPYATYKCAAGAYTFNVDFSNGASHVIIATTIVVRMRAAAPLVFDGFGTADYLRPGWAQIGYAGSTYAYYLNSAANSTAIQPFVSWTPPANAGDTYINETGHTVKVIVPYSATCAHQGSARTPINLDNSKVMCGVPYGNILIWDFTGASGNSPLYTLTGSDYNTADAGWWSGTNPNVIWVMKAASAGTANVYRRILLGVAPNYTVTDFYTLPQPSLGRVNPGWVNHQDLSRNDWAPVTTIKDYGPIVVNIAGTTITRVSGSTFDALLLKQDLQSAAEYGYYGVTVTSVNVGTQTLVMSGPPGDCTGCSIYFEVPKFVGAINLPAAYAAFLASTTYTPTLVDISGSTLPLPMSKLSNGQSGPNISVSVDPITGKYHMFVGNGNGPSYQTYQLSFVPNVDLVPTITTGMVAPMNPYGKTCDATAVVSPRAPAPENRCLTPPHATSFVTSDGTPYWGTTSALGGPEGYFLRMRDANLTPNYNNVSSGMPSSNEWGMSRSTPSQIAPYVVTSTELAVVADYQINCTVATPSVCTLTGRAPFLSVDILAGDRVVLNGVGGCTSLNGLHTAAAVSASTVTLDVGCSGSFSPALFGSAFIARNLPRDYSGRDRDRSLVCRNVPTSGTSCEMIALHRSVLFSWDSYSPQPRTAMSMDGTAVVYATSFGIPGAVGLMRANTRGCLGIQDNAFDCSGHASSASNNTVTYFTPNNGEVIVEIGKTKRWTDGLVGADQIGNCLTIGRTVLNRTNMNVFTCSAGVTSYALDTWQAITPDPTYKVVKDTTGTIGSRSATFSGLSTGIYFYRVNAGNQAIATGSFVAGSSSGLLIGTTRSTE